MTGTDPRRSRLFAWRLGLARAADGFELLWPALWPPLAVVGVFLAISLLGLWPLLPGWLHAVCLVVFALVLAFFVYRASREFVWPDRDAGLGRLERVNQLQHRPLRSLDDRLSAGRSDPVTWALWTHHQARLMALVRRLKVGTPRSGLPARDRTALRAALLLILVVALTEAGRFAPERLAQAFDLSRPGVTTVETIQLTVWVTPPAYTGLAPLALEAEESADSNSSVFAPRVVSLPQGSEVLAQLHHVDDTVEQYGLTLADGAQPFVATGNGSAEAKLVLEESGELRIGSQSEELGSWLVEAVPDRAPEIAMNGAPLPSEREVLRFQFKASDDYGVDSIALRMRRPGQEERDAESIELMRPAKGAVAIDDAAYLDLTPHPWAGLPVIVQLEAIDGRRQVGLSEPLDMILPARQFTHPVAQAIVEQRRRLADDPRRRERVAAALNGLSHMSDRYQNDIAVFMALRASATRLMFDDEGKAVDPVMELLWETALHLEDGSLSLAAKELRDLQDALRDALSGDASDAELERLMSELQQALENYLEALANQAREQMTGQEMQPADPNSQTIESQDLQNMLDRLRDMIQTGARDAAREMLAQLQEMLENLQVGQSGAMQQGQEMMEKLQELIEGQQELLDETYGMSREQQRNQGQQGQGQPQAQGQQGQPGQGQQGQGGQPGPQAGQMQQGGAAAMSQEELRRALGELMGSLGDSGVQIPRALGEAELSMREARDALQGGQPGEALDPQAQALDQMRQGGQAMMQEMQRMYGQGQQPGEGQQPGQRFGRNPTSRDPLGRSVFNQGGADQFGTRVPAELDLGKARAIMEELQRRAGQRHRPAEELDYLERLLKRF